MTWISFALICMTMTVAKTFLAKYLLQYLTARQFVLIDLISCLGFSLVLIPFADFQTIDATYMAIMVVICLPGVLGLTCLSRATQSGQVSEVAPLLTLIPALSALTSPFILDETITLQGALGIGIILGGAYLLKIENIKDPLGPIRAIKNEQAMRYIMVAIGLGILNVNLQKLLVLRSSPQTTLIIQQALLTSLALTLNVYGHNQRPSLRLALKGRARWIVLLGAVTTASCLSSLLAFSHGGAVAYVLSIKRLSIVVIALIAMASLKETYRFSKVLGIGFMVSGSIILASF